jgi:hypothetical protein
VLTLDGDVGAYDVTGDVSFSGEAAPLGLATESMLGPAFPRL